MTGTTTAAATLASQPACGEPAGQFISRVIGWVLTVGGAIGLTAAVVLTIERLAMLADPTYVPSCSINPVLSCGSVMNTPQAALFGFPNSLLGIAGFAIVATTGMAVLAGGQLQRWYWVGLQVGTAAAVVFVHWLIFQSLYVIGALCPYCVLVWAVTIPIFWYTTLHNANRGHLPVPARSRPAVENLTRHHGIVLTLWALLIITLVGQAFWPYWQTLL